MIPPLHLARGVHPKVVSEMLGHATIALTLDTYSHVIPSLQQEAASVVAAAVLDPPQRRLNLPRKAG
jgi:integrase